MSTVLSDPVHLQFGHWDSSSVAFTMSSEFRRSYVLTVSAYIAFPDMLFSLAIFRSQVGPVTQEHNALNSSWIIQGSGHAATRRTKRWTLYLGIGRVPFSVGVGCSKSVPRVGNRCSPRLPVLVRLLRSTPIVFPTRRQLSSVDLCKVGCVVSHGYSPQAGACQSEGASPALPVPGVLRGQCFLIEPIGPAAGGLPVGRPLLFNRLVDEGHKCATHKKVVKDVIVDHGGYALSSVPAMNTSRSP